MPNRDKSASIVEGEAAFQQWEHHLHAFVSLCSQPDLDAVPDSATHSDLAGMTVGVKDIIDVRGIPTRNGSAVCQSAAPADDDAAVVASLRAKGARIIGKTTTTEFAFTDPANCRNPYDLKRTPGGSSSGSGAAVAAGMVDMSLGTQTAGSLCRPAAYCGVVGFKPTYNVLPTAGVTPLAVSFDTVGIIARSIETARTGFLMMSEMMPPVECDKWVVASMLLPTEISADEQMQAAFLHAQHTLEETGTGVSDLKVQLATDDIVAAHRIVMTAEAAESHRHLLVPEMLSLLQTGFRSALETGAGLSAMQVADARALLSEAREAFWQQLDGVDCVLTLPVPEPAPLLDGTTGYQHWLTCWTVFGGPLVCLPWGLDTLGRPLSVMLATAPGRDLSLLRLAKRLEAMAPGMPAPTLPSQQKT
ncbi:MAG: amidase [Granulosicoccus sp.]